MADSIYDTLTKGLYKIELKPPSYEISPEQIASGTLLASFNQVLNVLQAGKTKFTNDENGYILGLDEGVAKFYIGSSTKYLNITDTSIVISGFSLLASSLDIPDTTTADSFHVDSDGNVWWGATTIGSAVAKVLKTGEATFTNITATGTINATAGYVDSATALLYESGGINIGDTGHIRGGQTDYNAGIGFFLGYSTDDYKFSIGNADTKMATWDGTNWDATGLRYIEKMTAGENISEGNIVCIKPSYSDIVCTKSSYNLEANPNTNYGDSAYGWLYVGSDGNGKAQEMLLQFDLSSITNPINILRAEMWIYCESKSGTYDPASFQIVSADWNETTITWNNKPAFADTPRLTYGDETKTSFAIGWNKIDITNIVRHQVAGFDKTGTAMTNYGFYFAGTGNTGVYARLFSDDGAEPPFIRIYKRNVLATNNLFKASSDDYLLCRNVVGIALQAINTGNTDKVQISGAMEGIFTGGTNYLYTAGGTTPELTLLTRIIPISSVINGSKALISIQRKDIMIEHFLTQIVDENARKRFYTPPDATKARIIIKNNAYYSTVEMRRGDYYENTLYQTYGNAGNTNVVVKIVWNIASNYLTITSDGGSALIIKDIYYYT